ncbi:unnamed protein product [Adineta steineri]|nr:unnamed protein product [Adineta steineri]CAF3844190.1 unnamed protein product [Adineta steineri]
MNKDSSTSCFSLEQFPDEIFMEIFQYISVHDLYRGLYKLNQRINHILHSITNLSLTLSKAEDINDDAVVFFASRIYHLVVRHQNPVEFNRFPSLRSLTSKFPQDRQLCGNCDIVDRLCRRIISNKLRYCSSWPPTFDLNWPIIATPLLTHVKLRDGDFDDLCILLNSCPNLKHLQYLLVKRRNVSFIRDDPDWTKKLDQLLSLLPNIKQLFLNTCS